MDKAKVFNNNPCRSPFYLVLESQNWLYFITPPRYFTIIVNQTISLVHYFNSYSLSEMALFKTSS